MKSNFQEHPDESAVIRFLDGELTEREANELRRHLDGCWQCRRNLGEWQGTIDAFLRLRENVLAGADPPPNRWKSFEDLYPAREAQAPARWWSLWKIAVMAGAVIVAVLAASIVLMRPAAAPVTPAPPRPREPAKVRETRAPETPASPVAGQGRTGLVRAALVLHELGADLGEPVAIEATATGATVRAHGLEPRRRQMIAEAMARIPGVVFEDVERMGAGARLVPAPGSDAERVAPRPKLYEAKLMGRFGNAAAVEAFANSVLDDGDAIAARAHALQALDGLFPAAAPLTAAERETIDGIVAEHRRVLRNRVRAAGERLRVVFEDGGTLTGGRGAVTDGGGLRAAIELDRLLNAAFAGAQVPLSDAELAVRIQSLLKELDR